MLEEEHFCAGTHYKPVPLYSPVLLHMTSTVYFQITFQEKAMSFYGEIKLELKLFHSDMIVSTKIKQAFNAYHLYISVALLGNLAITHLSHVDARLPTP